MFTVPVRDRIGNYGKHVPVIDLSRRVIDDPLLFPVSEQKDAPLLPLHLLLQFFDGLLPHIRITSQETEIVPSAVQTVRMAGLHDHRSV